MRRIQLLFCFCLFSAQLSAQTDNTKIKQGESKYNRFSYSKAIGILEDVKAKTTQANRELAESYYISGNTEKAEKCYETIVTAPDAKPEDSYRYAYILKVNGKYAESDKWMTKYGEKKSNDLRVAEFKNNAGNRDKLAEDRHYFHLFNLDINSDQQDFGAAYYFNDKQVVFASTREEVHQVARKWNGNGLSFLDIYVADVNDSMQFDHIYKLSNRVNKKFHEGPASVSADGKFMVFTRNNYKQPAANGTTNLQLFSREFVSGKWVNEKALPFNNKDYSVGHPALSPDGRVLYFSSDMPGGYGGTDLYKSTRQNDGSWTRPENLGNTINTEGNEMFPFCHQDDILFFASDGHFGLGGLDIFYTAIRRNTHGMVRNLGFPINTNKDDFALILDRKFASGFLSSNRTGGKGNDDIYGIKLLKPLRFWKTIKGTAKDNTGAILAATKVRLTGEDGKDVETVTTGTNGAYSFTVETDMNFTINGSKAKYKDGANKVSTYGDDEVVNGDVVLEKVPAIKLYCLVTEKITGSTLEGVKIRLKNNFTGETEEFTTSEAGDFSKLLPDGRIGDSISYTVSLEKESYLPKSAVYNKKFNRDGQFNIHEELDIKLDKIGADIAKIINLKPIYFSLAKWDIRPDAATQLNKIVKIMNAYPTMEIELGSHTDCRGSMQYNQDLSDKRAKSSADYIKKRIKNPERINGKGYGESKLVTNCPCEGDQKSACTEEQHQKNRRTEFIITKL